MFVTRDRIEVFSAGKSIGISVFAQLSSDNAALNLNNNFLLRVDDKDQSTHLTNMSTINIRKLNGSS
ncbi:hypothetical protein GLW00_16105 [Halobacillus litoralis]|uniref:Uncharacterized protein n=1 Tax=Halobacillus litoralis TaxID=45668 RepID=A0A845FEH2_9BACI|nr:hypothetical protein [Halobacillus litoralis]MYL72370.1 hypothetical protein [Halobacillus litoralis]